MLTLNVITRTGERHVVDASGDRSIMEALRDADVGDIQAICGGMCACATCHVYVEPGYEADLPPVGQDEDDLLDSSDHRRPTSRLGCQVRVNAALDGLHVTVAPED